MIIFAEDKSALLIGKASHGHYQIELACGACHTQAFGGAEAMQNACENCHSAELEASHDSHRKKKFTDPRNADRIEILDARYCVSCHTEHQVEQTRSMGLTLPTDYCYHCHKTIGEERESHAGLTYDSCASAGCHNYHDNRALYEEFLLNNADQAWLHEPAKLDPPNAASLSRPATQQSITQAEADAAQEKINPKIMQHWLSSSHALAGINCSGCHAPTKNTWLEKPGLAVCESCHEQEADGFKAGKHGMRLSNKMESHLGAINVEESPLEFKPEAAHRQQGCNACHSAHEFNTQFAASEACLACHNDEHSLAYLNSPHGELWQRELAGEIDAGQGVSCASCHMPRLTEKKRGKKITRVQHNQNDNLRPNEKMIRSVCMSCHGLEFAINALASQELIKNNFSGKPERHIESIDWAKKRNSSDTAKTK
ncbi:MAG: cytochrome c3 family protein [Cellvibrionaceae bacterium]|nr:cytochrome c3 family protein [Cellvibrionaceae bacterium]